MLGRTFCVRFHNHSLPSQRLLVSRSQSTDVDVSDGKKARGRVIRGHLPESAFPTLQEAGVRPTDWSIEDSHASDESVDITEDEDALEKYHQEKNQVLENCLSQRASDQFTFNPNFYRQTDAEEQKHFSDFKDVFGSLRFNKEDFNGQPDRQFITHDGNENKELWSAVEDALPATHVIPRIPDRDNFPSGFKRPTAKFGDYPYHIRRTNSHMLPVYVHFNRVMMLMTTVVKKADGDLFRLRDDLADLLREQYNMEFISTVHEPGSKVVFRGDFGTEFKEFLLSRGF